MSLHLKEAKLNELQEAIEKLEDEIKKEKEKWKANETLWGKLTNRDEYLKYKGYIHASKVRTKGFSHSNPKKSKSKMTSAQLASKEWKQGLTDKQKTEMVKGYDDAPDKAAYLKSHKHPLSASNINNWREKL